MHARAMEKPAPGSVKAPFAGERFSLHGVTSTFFRNGNRFIVRTDGPDGALQDFDVTYTFGVEPLQQYLLPLPGGRYQALSLSWDTRPAAAGGQRWFHLYEHSPIPAGDVQHWSSPSQNWNARCAECHSTNLRKGYDAARNSYKTTWSDISVSCESCHGAGSRHVAWARGRASTAPPAASEDDGLVPLGSKDGATWQFDASTGIAHRDRPRTSRVEVEMCARCHARRAVLTDDYHVGLPLTETHRPSLLDDGLYFADGQIQDEVYEYGSFLQSRMYANGVTCSDCHDPHQPEIASNPDAVCERCHQPAKYAAPSHHHHAAGSPGAQCVSCHMPARTYMAVDSRRDHSFRVPRPDLTVKIGTPNACTGCHADRPSSWAAAQAVTWFGTARTLMPHYGEAIAAGRSAAVDGESRLIAVVTDESQPAIVRATATSLLARWPDPLSGPVIESAARDPSPLVRMAAVDVLSALPLAVRPRALTPLLVDPSRAVRIEAARALATADLEAADRERRDRGVAEWLAVQAFNGDSAGAHVNLGVYYTERGEAVRAEAEYLTARRLEPYFAPAAVNLADLYRTANRDANGERVLRDALRLAPEAADLHHSLGLLLVRRKDLAGALVELKRASELSPDDANAQYTYAVALYSSGRLAGAIDLLDKTWRAHPGDRQVLAALVSYVREQGDVARARDLATRLVVLSPGDPSAAGLLEEIRKESQ
jgi:Flp pilus assembly protein TadD